MKRRFLTAEFIRARKADGHRQIHLEAGDVLTPLARDTARELGIELLKTPGNGGVPAEPPAVASAGPALAPPEPSAQVEAGLGTPNGNGHLMEALVRQVVATCLAQLAPGQPAQPGNPVKLVQSRSVRMEPFAAVTGHPEMDIQLVDVITAQQGSPMSAGFLSFHKGQFPWTLTYDEIEFVIEGEIHIGTAQGTVVGKPGDVLYVPKGASITFGTPGWAKILYVTYPAEWAA